MTTAIKCSFCEKDQHEVDKIISAHDRVYICNECIAMSLDIILKEDKLSWSHFVPEWFLNMTIEELHVAEEKYSQELSRNPRNVQELLDLLAKDQFKLMEAGIRITEINEQLQQIAKEQENLQEELRRLMRLKK